MKREIDVGESHLFIEVNGGKNVYYTLWHQSSSNASFVKNLSLDREKAIQKAEEYAQESGFPVKYDNIDRKMNPRLKHDEFQMYGLTFVRKSKRTRERDLKYYYVAKIDNQEFWDAWKKDKQKIKAKGFYLYCRETYLKHEIKKTWYCLINEKPKLEIIQ